MPAEAAPDTPETDTALVRRLLQAQFPHWADLPLRRVEPGGSDHVIHRLGDTMAVRLPRGDWAAGQAEKEHVWLPRLAPRLPLAVPVPLAVGTPAFGYPWHWCVARWLDGATPTAADLTDPQVTAAQLAGFLTALQAVPTADDLAAGPHNGSVGAPLATRDVLTRDAVAAVAGDFDAGLLTAVWEAALAAPAWDRPPVWVHGDLHTGNLLAVDGRLSAVIDFGGLGVGDPACDLVIAWTLLDAPTRETFRAALGVDDATWLRGRGWALTTGLNAYKHYAATDPRVAAATRHQITRAVAGFG
ncbi:aminoglycoside phosphotransferase family protein [Kitasatospora sp. CM 4170]|uniref:Aminoglycoside phosphotransferase family protein n=1 Tax=Kitasatospora aburaviensis TaxID=67265 RepID=A0ABW1F3T5_9ACTN|nr:aminoglycoside phosphotransferase family protein [Kitasatospora sp. CM 4170]WNM47589.1 aminoglycoside phosphotransferase family protein [Kitasatospora sp. CM 4170]